MQNNYYFLRQLSRELHQKLRGWTLSACFSQNKEELILEFTHDQEEFYIKAALGSDFSCLSFPQEFHRSKKNNINLFTELDGAKVLEVKQYLNERCFSIHFENDYTLLFKMHGNRSNIVLFHKNHHKALFKNKLVKDSTLRLEALDRPIAQDFSHFKEAGYEYQALFPTFGKVVKQYLKLHHYPQLSPEEKWSFLMTLKQQLEKPVYYITRLNDSPVFSLLEVGEVVSKPNSPLKALNEFFYTYTKTHHLEKEKTSALKSLERKKAQSVNYINKIRHKLGQLEGSTKNEEIANIIMANLHQIPSGVEEAALFNFYTNETVHIKLKKEHSPQKNAELYYRKAKNEKIEINQLKENLSRKEAQITSIEAHQEAIEKAGSIKALRQYLKEHQISREARKQEAPLPYKEFIVEGYKILIGKNARSNDVLTQKYAWKEDLWLHAKDVPGSHVLIKYIPGKNFPKSVIEKAARLAAFYSKRKHDSLCPVIYTPKKFVRKPKGSHPGEVVVDKEKVILVEPGRSES